MTKKRYWMSLFMVLSLLGALLAGCGGSKTDSAGGNDKPQNTNQQTDNNKQGDEQNTSDAGTPKDGGTFTFSSASDIVSINPIFVSDTASGDAELFAFAKIYDLDRAGNLVVEPWSLAESLPEISEDGKTYTVKLKSTPKWSDGQPVTVDDIIFTINTITNPEVGAPGISEYDKVDKLEKIDDQTVKITLKDVYAPFGYTLNSTIAPAHILKDVDPKELKNSKFGVDPAQTVSNGPWKWTEWKQKQYLTFEADSNYWGEVKPHIGKVIYKIYADQNTEVQALLKGDVDSVQSVPLTQLDAIKGQKGITISNKPGASYEFISFNFDPNNFKDKFIPFASQKARQAIAHALNRQGMVDNVLKGTGILMNAPFLPGSWADPGDKAVNYAYDAEAAKKLLAEDGWVANSKDGILEKDGKRFSFELQYNAGNSRREQIAAIAQQNLKEVGIELIPKAIDFSAWVEQNLNPGKYETVLLGWSLSNPDPNQESIFSSHYFPEAGQNMGWYKNEKLDQLWIDGYSTVDQNERKAIYADAAHELSTDLPYIFMYQYGTPQAIGPKVKFPEEDGPEPTRAYGYFYHIIKWWVE